MSPEQSLVNSARNTLLDLDCSIRDDPPGDRRIAQAAQELVESVQDYLLIKERRKASKT